MRLFLHFIKLNNQLIALKRETEILAKSADNTSNARNNKTNTHFTTSRNTFCTLYTHYSRPISVH